MTFTRSVQRSGFGNERGQLTIEAILIMTVLLTITISFSKYARDNGLVANLVEGPWLPIQGMIEDGVWQSPKKGKFNHPSQKKRHSSNQGETIPAT